MSRLHVRKSTRRRGTTLVIVVAFLALGMSVGIAFVFKASHQARFMQMVRESQAGGRAASVNTGSIGNNDEAPPQPSDLFNTALGQLIYDVPDDETGWFNALRGHSFARSMYGWKDAATALTYPPPFSGFGRTHFTQANLGVDDFGLINYTRHDAAFVRNPERDPSNNYIAKSRPYTYPDENDVYLAAVRSDGYVLVPSFHRPWLAGVQGSSMWTNAEGKYRILRPRGAADGHTNFAAMVQNNVPLGTTGARDGSWGDVENLEGKNIVNNGAFVPSNQNRQLDSVWIDLDAPVRKWKGRMYKPMFAFLVVDLDGRINANTAMNLKGNAAYSSHSSNQGWGPWEVDMNNVIPGGQANLLLGTGATGPTIRRFGNDNRPTKVFALDNTGVVTASPTPSVPHYARTDFDASTTTTAASPARFALPLDTAAPAPQNSLRYFTSPVTTDGTNIYNWAPRYADGSSNFSTGERDYHPLIYNPYLVPQKRATAATNSDRAFGPQDMYILNQKLNGQLQAYYQSSDMGALATQLIQQSYLASIQNPRWLLTTISNDVQVPGLRPWRTPTGATYQKPNANTLASGAAISTPTVGAPPVAANSDFDPNWRSLVAALGSVDITRKLTDYRGDVAQSYEATVSGQANGAINFTRAQADRQYLAKDIFDRLAAATGARTSASETLPDPAGPSPEPERFHALRQLAQMAVNIVDYIDNDDYMTPFRWNSGLPGAGTVETLWGTERPRLVINEAYSMLRNDPTEPGNQTILGDANSYVAVNNYQHRVWVELYNPTTLAAGADAALSHGGAAPLVFNTNPVYQIKILRDADLNLRTETNYTGETGLGAGRVRVVSPLGADNSVVPVSNATAGDGTATGNTGFYLIGPGNFPGNDATTTVNFSPPAPTNMSIDDLMPNAGNEAVPTPPTLLLQRLAHPHRAPQTIDPTAADYNPYITVDYVVMPANSVYDYRTLTSATSANPRPFAAGGRRQLSEHRSVGRSQPFAAHPTRIANQEKTTAPMNDDAIHHTFYRQNYSTDANCRLDNPFDWLVHLDRQPISPIELICVSAWKPHELTQQFITAADPGAGVLAPRHQHLADWGQVGNAANSNAARLFRALALLEVRNRTQGMPFAGRVPGRININTIWDRQVFESMCDPNAGNFFTQADIRNAGGIWERLTTARSPMINTGGTAVWTTNPTTLTDKPFLPGAAFVPAGDTQLPAGEDLTWSVFGSGILNTTQTHPYLKNEMMQKVFNNITTRSNTFAIWCTIGYFEVTNPGPYTQSNRPRLGAELDLDVGANIRHKFYAIVDRTNLTIDPSSTTTQMLQGSRPVFLSYEPVPQVTALRPTPDVLDADYDTTTTRNNIQVRVPATSTSGGVLLGTYDGETWRIRVGDNIMVYDDSGQNPQTASVTAVSFVGAGTGGDITINLPAVPMGSVGSRHSRGCAMQLPIPNPTAASTTFARLGNPGPQPRFNYRDARYSGVVRHFIQVK